MTARYNKLSATASIGSRSAGETKPVEAQLVLWRMLGGEGEVFTTASEGKAAFGRLMASKKCLLILDDIWETSQVEAFDILDEHSRILITTRDSRLIAALGAKEQAVELLDKTQAIRLLADWAGQTVSTLPDTADEVVRMCERLPLALALCVARVKGGVSWDDVLAALKAAELDYLDDPHGSVMASIGASVTALPEREVRLYRLLGAIAEDAVVPERALLVVWSLPGQISEHIARRDLVSLAQKALLWLEGETQGERVVSLHDLLHLYLRREAGAWRLFTRNGRMPIGRCA